MSTISSSTTTTTAYVVTADTTGTLVIQTGATPTTAVTVGTDQSVALAGNLTVTGTTTTTGYINVPNTFGFKNRIINGAMVIDQRRAGASVTPADGNYLVDRWLASLSAASKYSVQQNAGSVTPPAGFTNYLGVTSLSAYSVGAAESFSLIQFIEGFNVFDFGFGAAGASTVTLSFWVRSSLTGNFGGALTNGAVNRSYPFSFSINAANTWEQKSITIAGDTTGTWATNNTSGMGVWFSLGAGSSTTGTANVWAASGLRAPTGSVSVVGTNGATFYITGVQLEKGSTATSFDYRPYGTEFQLCQRYYEQWNVTSATYLALGMAYAASDLRTVLQFQVPKRAAATASFSGTVNFTTASISKSVTSFSFDGTSVNSTLMYNGSQTGLTVGQALQIQAPGGSSATLTFSAEL